MFWLNQETAQMWDHFVEPDRLAPENFGGKERLLVPLISGIVVLLIAVIVTVALVSRRYVFCIL